MPLDILLRFFRLCPLYYARRGAALWLVCSLSGAVFGSEKTSRKTIPPTEAQIAAELDRAAHVYRVPSVLLKGLAWRESGWRQFDSAGKPFAAGEDRVGVLGVPVGKRADSERLRTDYRYNIEQGTRALVLAWNRAPLMCVSGRLDDWRNVLECWYFALGRYQLGKQGPDAQAFADSVLNVVATGADGRFSPVAVSRPRAGQLAWGKNALAPPAPWHWGDTYSLAPSPPVVALSIPYLNQIYDSPDTFDGGGSCGPTSMLMVLAFFGKAQARPTVVTQNGGARTTAYGALIPQVDDKVCEPNLGAVHAKMLDYFRPSFPGVAIFYDDKANWPRVKRELDAGRPVILGTSVTNAGHIMVARGYLEDGRLLVNDPAGDREQAARRGGPKGGWSPTGVRYWNGDGGKAVYEWDALAVRWVMTFGPKPPDADRPEDE